MTCNYKTQNEYKGKIIKMADYAQNTNQAQNQNVPTPANNLQPNTPNASEYVAVPKETIRLVKWGIGIALGIIGWMAIMLFTLSGDVRENTTLVTTLVKDVDDLKSGVYGNSNTKGVTTRLEIIENMLGIVAINTTDEFSEMLAGTFIEDNKVPTSSSPFSSTSTIGLDADGNKYVAEDLVNQKILLTYKEDGKTVYFYGQYNENYHWDGYCITNAYNSNGTLYGICESNYDDGTRLDYKTVLSTGSNQWDYYERACDEKSNSGISISYKFKYDKIANFTTTNVRVSDILDTEKFLQNQNKIMLQYYSGSTSNGKYNDTSGKAYHVKYDEDGTIRTLYVGNFKNGTYNDTTGNAWDIAYSDELGYYVCNTGSFKNGNAVNKSKVPFAQEKINEKIGEYEFGCKLKWKETE